MDEMNVKLSTKIMKSMVAKLMSKMIFKKTGYEIDIQLEEMEIKTYDGKIHIHIDAKAESNSENLVKLIKGVGLD